MYLVTGSCGQLGSELQRLLPNALFADVTELDITDASAVAKFVKSHQVDTIINCAAYTAVDKAEDDETAAYKINVEGPANLAATGAKIIHISTDYVFDGLAHKPYTPEDTPNPVSVYGRTKLAGEQAVLQQAETAIIIRTSWLYSIFGNNFVKTMHRLGSEKESLNVVNDQIGTPTYAFDLAQAIVKILPQLRPENKGIYHFSNEGVCSWYDFATEIMALSGLSCQVSPIPSEAYPTRANRPYYSVLNKQKIRNIFGVETPHWKESLAKCLKQF